MEFHIGDPVTCGKGRSFVVTGIKKVGEGTFYCGETGDWVAEVELDYDFTDAQKRVMEEFERCLWNIRRYGQDLEQLLVRVRNEFSGQLPPAVRHELDMVRRIVGEAPQSKLPGSLERSDILQFCFAVKQLMGYTRELMPWAPGLKDGAWRADGRKHLQEVQDAMRKVEDNI